MHAALHAIATFLERPEIQAILGLCLVVSGGLEIVADFAGEGPVAPGAHHGVAVFGVAHTLRQVPELAEGLSKVLFGAEELGAAETADERTEGDSQQPHEGGP